MSPYKKNKIRLLVVSTFIIVLLILFFHDRQQTKKNTLYLYNWSSYTPSAVIDEFEKEYGVHVSIDNFSSNEELFAKLLSGAEGYDLIFPSQDYTEIMIHLGLLEKLDHSQLPNLKYVSSRVKDKATYDPTMDYAVPYFMGACGIAVNTDHVKEYERNWSIFSRKDLAGKMTMMDDMREILGDALAYNGYSVNSTNPEELQKAEDTIMNEWKPNLVKFDSDAFGQGFASGDFDVVHGYAEVVYESVPQEEWDHIDFFIPEDGATMYIDNMCIPKGCTNYDLALEFINFIHRPDIYVQFLDEFGFPPTVNEEAGKLMSEQPYYAASEIDNCEIMEDLGAHLNLFNDAWQRIRYTK